ncbi:MAG: tetratricopeptide repeat protein [bacterium]
MAKKSKPAPALKKKFQPEISAGGGFLLVFGVALILRLGYLIQAQANDPLFFSPQMDALYHHQWARAILNRVEFINDAYFRAPLYPFFLALLYRFLGVNLFVVRLVQAVLGSLSCGLLFFLGSNLFDRRIGFLAGLVMAVYPLFIYYDGELLIPVLLVFLTQLGFFTFYLSERLDRHWYLPGFIFGLGAIARPNILVFFPGIFFWFIWRYRPGWWRRATLFFLAALIPIVPVAVRNYIKSGKLVLIAWQAGTNFYIGNNEFSDGTTAIVPGTRGSWWGGYNDVKAGAEMALGRNLKGAEIDRFWMAKGVEFWRQKPVKALFLTLKKVYLWFSGYEVSNNRDLYFFKRYSFLNFLLFALPFLKFPLGLVFPLALAGFYLLRAKWRVLLPVYLFTGSYALSFVPFFITARYRLTVLPFYLLAAVGGLMRWHKADGREKVRAGLIFLLAFFFFNLDIAGAGRRTNPAQNHFTAALGYYEMGKRERAKEELQQALALDSATNILSLEATLYLEEDKFEKAQRVARAVVQLHPEEADAYGVAGNVFAQIGAIDSAEMMFRRTVELDPYGFEGWNNLGNIALIKRDFSSAKRFYQRARELNPGFTTAIFNLGLAYYYEGEIDSARILWQQILVIEPNNEKARQALRQLL